jgi:hypothetical protein
MDMFLVGLYGLMLLAMWKYMFKRTILDDHRDRLFDLRDHLRAKFVQEGWSMNDPIYRRLRDLINGYLRFTESYSFHEFLVLERGVRHNPELQSHLKARMTADFETTTTGQAEFVAKFRHDAVGIMMSYMTVSSGPLFTVMLFLLPVIAVARLATVCVKGVMVGGASVFGHAVELQELALMLIKYAIAVVANWLHFEEFVEEYSYRYGSHSTTVLMAA